MKKKIGINNEKDVEIACYEIQKGITLIALVITIIILLILTGVTLNLIVGEHGIFKIAEEAREKQSRAVVYEKVNVMLSEYAAKRYTENKELIDFLNEKKISKEIQNVIDNNNGTYTIEVDGCNFTIKERDLSIIEISKTGPNPQISNIKITLEDGITVPDDYSVEVGTKLKINFNSSIAGGQIKSIEPNIPYITNGTELEKEFTIISTVGNTDYSKTIIVSLKDKYTLKKPEIILSNDGWTKDNIQVTVNWFNDNENLNKEISLDGGITYKKYNGEIEVGKNCVIKAKISNDTKEAIGEKTIDKIDKLEPNSFTPGISDLVSSTELRVGASVQDKEATEEYGKSGIKGYVYYIYKDEELIDKSDLINKNSWIASGLSVGEDYEICVTVYDNAGNNITTEKVRHSKLEVYKWAEYKADVKKSYELVTEEYEEWIYEEAVGIVWNCNANNPDAHLDRETRFLWVCDGFRDLSV